MMKEKFESKEQNPETEVGEIETKKKGKRFKSARGKTTRYSCPYSTMPIKSRHPPKV